MSVPIRVAHAVAQISMFKGLAAHFLGAISPTENMSRDMSGCRFGLRPAQAPPMLGHKNA